MLRIVVRGATWFMVGASATGVIVDLFAEFALGRDPGAGLYIGMAAFVLSLILMNSIEKLIAEDKKECTLKEISIMPDGRLEPGFVNGDEPIGYKILDPQPKILPWQGDVEYKRKEKNRKAREAYAKATPEEKKKLATKRKAKN